MFDLIYCIRDEHDPRLVFLAGLICIAVSMVAVFLLRHAKASDSSTQRRWIAGAGLATGFGIWSTHFVAMLGYDPGVVLGYDAPLTFLSLGVAIITTGAGFALAFGEKRPFALPLAALIVGLGFSSMHYIGMMAVEFPGSFRWSAGRVALSIVFSIVPLIPALPLILHYRSNGSAMGAGFLLTTSIFLLHFTGMTALTIIPGPVNASHTALISPIAMGLMIGAAAFTLIALSAIAVMISAGAREKISRSEREFRVLVQGVTDCAIYMLDETGHVSTWNAGAQRLKGYREDQIVGQSFERFYTEEERASGFPANALETARSEGAFRTQGWRCRQDGSRFWAHVLMEALHDEAGKFIGFAKITRDMTQFKEDQERLSSLAANLDAALSNMYQGLCLFDEQERLVVANPRMSEIFGFTPEQVKPGTLFRDLLRTALEIREGSDIPEEMVNSKLRDHRKLISLPQGGSIVTEFTDSCTLSIAHKPMASGGWVSTYEDISQRLKDQQRIEHLALHDRLTGLPNRIHFNERLDTELSMAARNHRKVAVVGIDLDRFQEINDNHGHTAGDVVLEELSERMSEISDDGAFFARFGGDEFAAFKTLDDDASLSEFVQRLEGIFADDIASADLTVAAGASIGIALFPQDGDEREQAMNNANLAMYRAKETAGVQVCYFEHGMDEAARARRIMTNDLRKAIARDELQLLYQVQRRVADNEVTGFEALLRWHHHSKGMISPEKFIPIAEESGEILKIGEWVLRTACAEAASWDKPLRVAVNLSPVQLMDVNLIQVVQSALMDTGLPAGQLELEITESALISDKARALHILRQIKALGISIAIDDFGTGYSSLDTLHSFPFDKIKIDKSFLQQASENHQARAIIRAVLALGRSLNLPVLAEGLETEEQLALLELEGCDEAQGFLYGRPEVIMRALEGGVSSMANAH